MAQIKEQIAVGGLKPGDKIPAVREMAIEAGVNPNTMQKALAELEREGLLYSQRTAGRFVSGGEGTTRELQVALQLQYMQQFTENMGKLGFSPKQALDAYQTYIKS